MVVDGHCHIGHGVEKQQTVDELLREMDRWGVDRAVICPVEEQIILHNREGNQLMLDAVQAHPDRFVGFAVANPWYGAQAVEELRWAVGQGLRGLKLDPARQGFFLSAEMVYPLIEAATDLGIPVYCHTATPIYALPMQLRWLSLDFPETVFIMGHGAFPDYWFDVLPTVQGRPNIYIETSLRASTAPLTQAAHDLGADHLIFGSNSPTSTIEVELAKVRSLGLSPADEAWVLGGTIEKLLGSW
ncbi:MAG: amidohydrolase [Chloroflexi bacterium]|nr:amidohydrolase [Chloroflexota bacterium]